MNTSVPTGLASKPEPMKVTELVWGDRKVLELEIVMVVQHGECS